MKLVIEDKGQHENKHIAKHLWFEKNGIYWERYPLPVADYILANEKVLDVIKRKTARGTEIKKLDFLGTYDVAVDTKKDIQEIISNICGKQHARFRDECILAKNNGIKLFVLIENVDNVKCIEDLFRWDNPRLERYNKTKYMHSIGRWMQAPLPKTQPTSGKTLAKAMFTMQLKYDVTFVFCKPSEAGARIIELLTTKKV